MERDKAIHSFCNQPPGIWHPSQACAPITFIAHCVRVLRITHVVQDGREFITLLSKWKPNALISWYEVFQRILCVTEKSAGLRPWQTQAVTTIRKGWCVKIQLILTFHFVSLCAGVARVHVHLVQIYCQYSDSSQRIFIDFAWRDILIRNTGRKRRLNTEQFLLKKWAR